MISNMKIFNLLVSLCFRGTFSDSSTTNPVIQLGYHWKTSQWSDCLVSDRLCGVDSSGSFERHEPVFGTRSRRVWCGRGGDDVAEEEYLCHQSRPLSTASCTTYCVRSKVCHPSQWTGWSPCSACFGKQSRSRTFPCSTAHRSETQERTCFSQTHCSAQHQTTIKYEPGSRRKEHETDEFANTPLALMTRSQAITHFKPYLYIGPWGECKNPSGSGEETTGMKNPGKKRLVKRDHRKPVGPAADHRKPVGPADRRHRRQSPKNWPPDFPMDLEMSFSSSASTSSVSPPQTGLQTRDVQCRGQDGEELPLRVCIDGRLDGPSTPLTVRSCVVPVRCKTTQWSEWRLEANCTQRIRRLSRNRTILKPPQGDGRPCPHLVEFKQGHDLENDLLSANGSSSIVSHEECKEPFVLVASSWSECIVTDTDGNAATCGGGLQDRNITCMRGDTQQPVDITVCSHLNQLPRVQRCFVPCVDACKVGPWSEWTYCVPKDCSQSGHSPVSGKQTRSRRVESATITLSACPHLEESRDCSVPSCYEWKLAQKDQCHLPSGKPCGKGTRKLFFTCTDHLGNPAKVEYCSRLRPPPFEEHCQLLCPGECVVSEWTDWGTCPTVCFKRDRLPLVYRNRTILALGYNETGPNVECGNLSEVKVCREEDCDVHHWQAGLWGPCRALDVMQETGCGRGIRTRDVICVSKSTENRVPEWRCNGLAQPVLQQSCLRPCPQDCQLTEWSEWSTCQQNCDQDSFNLDSSSSFAVITSTQTRYRRVLQWPREGGKTCQNLIDVRPCPLLGSACSSYQWKAEEWSKCHLPEGTHCGEGVRTRGLQCIKGGVKADMSSCLEKPELRLPPQIESCTIDCNSGCVQGPWTEWSSCSQSCPSVRTRKRIIHQKGNPFIPCRTNVSHPMESVEEQPCPCQKYQSAPGGQWSQCILENGSGQSSVNIPEMSSSAIMSPFCGIGKRFRRLDCLDSTNQLADHRLCGKEPYEEESCIVACPTDCLMSTWSEWGLCDAICGAGLKNRTSKVLRLASIGGRPCPGPSVQYATCNYPCESFQWMTGGWSECNLLDKRQHCGKGLRTRAIRCVEKISGGIEVDVPGTYCDPANIPPEEEDCQLFCPEECVLSEWTQWSSCLSDDCIKNGIQKRNRTVLRSSEGKGLSLDCNKHHLTEERACEGKCFYRYEWRLTPWSSCRPVGDSACGEGRRFRGAKCVRVNNGRPVRESFCNWEDRPVELESRCPMDCPIDCEVSPWTDWDNSVCRCGRRQYNMTRSRVVTTDGSPTGRPCPFNLIESKPCPSRPCYKWVRTTWTCDLQGAECGVGLARRNVTCERSGADQDVAKESIERCKTTVLESIPANLLSTVSEESSIGKLLDTSEIGTCFKSCSPDCVLSEWTTWSDCKGKCIGEPTIGTKTRDRRILREAARPHGQCLSDLKETSICLAEACHNYNFVNINGKMECTRSDGVIVQAQDCYSNGGGGLLGQVPGQLQQGLHPCDPPCDIPYSECNSDLRCVCRRGFIPTYLPAPILSSRSPKLILCSTDPYRSDFSAIMSHNDSLIIGKGHVLDTAKLDNATLNGIQYYPNDSELNHWMLAMIGIGCIFIAFVGVSIYLMCKSNNQETADRNLKSERTA